MRANALLSVAEMKMQQKQEQFVRTIVSPSGR